MINLFVLAQKGFTGWSISRHKEDAILKTVNILEAELGGAISVSLFAANLKTAAEATLGELFIDSINVPTYRGVRAMRTQDKDEIYALYYNATHA